MQCISVFSSSLLRKCKLLPESSGGKHINLIMSDFYLYLPSNVDDEILNQTNTQSKYRINLVTPISLDGEWELALKEMWIPNYCYNITELHNMLEISAIPPIRLLNTKPNESEPEGYVIDRNGYVYKVEDAPPSTPPVPPPNVNDSRKTVADITYTRVIRIPPGKYTPSNFCTTFNKLVKTHYPKQREVFLGLKCVYDQPTKKICFHLKPGQTVRCPSRKLATMLGFDNISNEINNRWENKVKRRRPLPRPAQFRLHGKLMYVYCNLPAYSQVGDVFAPILRVFDMEEDVQENDENIHRKYPDAHYHLLKHNLIKEVEIELYDAYGTSPEFGRGNVLAVVHFRPRKT